MKERLLLAALLVLGTVFLRADGCIMKDKVVEVVVYHETCAEFPQDEENATFANPAVIDFDADVDDALKEAGYSRDDIESAKVVAGYYGALENTSAHDWTISGQITVQRLGAGGAVTAITYASQSVDAALGKKIKAPIEPAATDLVNQALIDYIAGQTGIQLEFVINNGSTTPTPNASDRMQFKWKAWIEIYVTLKEDVEWPDPF